MSDGYDGINALPDEDAPPEDFSVAISYNVAEHPRGQVVRFVEQRRAHRTARIKPATRDALNDVLAGAANEIIDLRSRLAAKRPLWQRFCRRALTLWTGA